MSNRKTLGLSKNFSNSNVKYDDIDEIGLEKICKAVLYRAYRDLYSRTKEDRQSAINWFCDPRSTSDKYITFASVCELIDIDEDVFREKMKDKYAQISKSIPGWSRVNRLQLFKRQYRGIAGGRFNK